MYYVLSIKNEEQRKVRLVFCMSQLQLQFIHYKRHCEDVGRSNLINGTDALIIKIAAAFLRHFSQ